MKEKGELKRGIKKCNKLIEKLTDIISSSMEEEEIKLAEDRLDSIIWYKYELVERLEEINDMLNRI